MTLLHEELRRAREEARLSQQALATLAGIPRNQIVRAEQGENITIDTLRKIVPHLPLNQLPLLETKSLEVAIFAEPENTLRVALDNAVSLATALRSATDIALEVAKAALVARGDTVIMKPVDDPEAGRGPDVIFVLRILQEQAEIAERVAKNARVEAAVMNRS